MQAKPSLSPSFFHHRSKLRVIQENNWKPLTVSYVLPLGVLVLDIAKKKKEEFDMFANKNLHEIPRFVHRRKHLYVNEKYTDCEFIVGEKEDETIIRAHKLFLTMASPVFEEMFFGLKPCKQPVHIADVRAVVFKKMINFIYTDVWTISDFGFENTFDLCFLAKKYLLPELEERCIQTLLSKVEIENVCRLYEFSKTIDEPRLLQRTKSILSSETMKVLKHDSCMEMKESTFLVILGESYVESEGELFEVLKKYVAYKERQEGFLDSALRKMRFLRMTSVEFVKTVAGSQLLSENDCFRILTNICYPSTKLTLPDGFSYEKGKPVKELTVEKLQTSIEKPTKESKRKTNKLKKWMSENGCTVLVGGFDV